MSEPIVFDAVVCKVSTLAGDGGIRIAFDLPEYAIPQAAAMMEFLRKGVSLRIAVSPGAGAAAIAQQMEETEKEEANAND